MRTETDFPNAPPDVRGLSDEVLAGQRLMVGFDGLQPSDRLLSRMETCGIGGAILFSRNVESPEQLKRLCSSTQERARTLGLPPMLVAVDQEGGVVARLKAPFTVFPGNPRMGGLEDAIRFGRISAAELSGVGINMNMAPVLDVAPEGFESVMAQRMFGGGPRRTARMGRAVVESLQAGGVASVAKHFPGIGRTTLDSHEDLPRCGLSPEELARFDLPPFLEAADAGCAGIMLSHILYEKLDPLWPASLSTAIGRELLRRRLGFRGLVLTDDLDMGAVERHFDIGTCVSRIFEAEIDIALICHESPKIERAFERMVEEVGRSEESRRKARESARRILSCKRRFAIQPGVQS